MTNIIQSANDCPRVNIAIEHINGVNTSIAEFFSPTGLDILLNDFTFKSSYAPPLKNIGLNQSNGSDFPWGYAAWTYPSGFSIVREENGNIIFFNKGNIDINSAIDLTNAFHLGDWIGVSDNVSSDAIAPDITIVSCDGDINVNKNITVPGRITLMAPNGTVSNTATISSATDRIIINACLINNSGLIDSPKETVLCDQLGITNTGTVTGQRIVAKTSFGGTKNGDRIIVDDCVIPNGASDIPSGPASGTLTITSLTDTQYDSGSGATAYPGSGEISKSGNIITINTTKNVFITSAVTLNTSNIEIITPGTVTTEAITAASRNVKIVGSQVKIGDTTPQNINVNGQATGTFVTGGTITLISQTTITTGQLLANGGGNGGTGAAGANNATGGTISLIASGDISTNIISANGGGNGGNGATGSSGGSGGNGGNNGDGGVITLITSGNISTSTISANGGSKGGDAGFDSSGGFTPSNAGAGGNGADGGVITLIACGNITLANIFANGGSIGGIGGNGRNGGTIQQATIGGLGGTGAEGGVITLISAQNIVAGTIEAKGGSTGGEGGAGGTTSGSNDGANGISGGSGGNNAHGGKITLIACGNISAHTINVNGGAGGGKGGKGNRRGVGGELDGQGGPGGTGGTNADGGIITIIACGNISIIGIISADGGSNGGEAADLISTSISTTAAFGSNGGNGGSDGDGGIIVLIACGNINASLVSANGGSNATPGKSGRNAIGGSGGNGGNDGDGGIISLIACGKISTQSLFAIGGSNGGDGVNGSSPGNNNGGNGGAGGNDADGGIITLIACGSISTSALSTIGGSLGGIGGDNGNTPGSGGNGGSDVDGGSVTLIAGGNIFVTGAPISADGGGNGGRGGVKTGFPNLGARGNGGLDCDGGSITLIAHANLSLSHSASAPGGGRLGTSGSGGTLGSNCDGGRILLKAYGNANLPNFDISHSDGANDGIFQAFSQASICRDHDVTQSFPLTISGAAISNLSDTTGKITISGTDIIVPSTANDGDVAVIQGTSAGRTFLTHVYLQEFKFSQITCTEDDIFVSVCGGRPNFTYNLNGVGSPVTRVSDQRYMFLPGPFQAGTAVFTVTDALGCIISDTCEVVSLVCSVNLSTPTYTPNPACVDSFFDVFFNVAIQNGTSPFIRTTLTWLGSDYVSDFSSGLRSFRLFAPHIPSDYPLTIKSHDVSDINCADIKTTIVKVTKLTLSEVHGGPACVDSFFDIFFTIDNQNGSPTTKTTLTWQGSDYVSHFTAGTHTFTVKSPPIPGTNTAILRIEDTTNPNCSDVHFIPIEIVQLALQSTAPIAPVCAGQPYPVSWHVEILNGSPADTMQVIVDGAGGSPFIANYPNPGSDYLVFLAPNVASDYVLTVTAAQNQPPYCSDTQHHTLKVQKTSITNASVLPNPICRGQDYTVSWVVATQNGTPSGTVKVTIDGAGNHFESDYSNNSTDSVIFTAPMITSDYPITITAQDQQAQDCSDTQTVFLSVVEITVDAGADQEIAYGQSTTLGSGSPAPGVSYVWTPGGMTVLNPIVSPTTTTTYSVIATLSDMPDCIASDSVTVMVCHLQLSDIQFTGLGQTAFTLSGTQFGSKSGTRFVDITYQNQTHHHTLAGDGPFTDIFSNITVGANVTIHTYYSDNLACSDIKTFSTQEQNNQGVIGFKLVGSLLAFDLALTTEATLALLPTTSDIHVAIQRLCDFTKTQPCERTVASLTITQQSDVFTNNNVIMQGSHIVFVSCSDDTIYLNDVDGGFLFNIHPFLSDNVVVSYTDNLTNFTEDMMFVGSGFTISFNDEKFAWINPCFSDYPHVAIKDVVDCPLLCADINSPVTGLDTVNCIPLCHDHTSDTDYVCGRIHCADQTEKYLTDHFSDFTISDKCCVTYSGPITADNLKIDLDNCQLLFSSLHLPPCSDSDPC